MEVFVDLAGLIDVPAEIARLEKALTRIEGQIQSKRKKLANQKFVEQAPPEIVQRERDGLDRLYGERESVAEALDKLRGGE